MTALAVVRSMRAGFKRSTDIDPIPRKGSMRGKENFRMGSGQDEVACRTHGVWHQLSARRRWPNVASAAGSHFGAMQTVADRRFPTTWISGPSIGRPRIGNDADDV